jgi:septal ring-binding cell division protein DamX
VHLVDRCHRDAGRFERRRGAAGGDELFILPVVLNGRACFRVCWGVYGSRPAADAALATIPAYFRQGGAKPRVSTLGELLP